MDVFLLTPLSLEHLSSKKQSVSQSGSTGGCVSVCLPLTRVLTTSSTPLSCLNLADCNIDDLVYKGVSISIKSSVRELFKSSFTSCSPLERHLGSPTQVSLYLPSFSGVKPTETNNRFLLVSCFTRKHR